jgi:hypothetical protein
MGVIAPVRIVLNPSNNALVAYHERNSDHSFV